MPTIRTLEERDVPALQAHFERHRQESGRGDPHFMPFEPGASDGPRGLAPETLALSLHELRWQRWFVAIPNGETLIRGHVNLKADGLHTGSHRCELGLGIERPYRRLGLGLSLMERAIAFARASETIEWIDLRVFAHNGPARALYGRLGFREVGTLVDRFRISGESIDDVLMVLNTA